MLRKKLHGLYAITDASVNNPETIARCAEQALLGGARLIQYRDKTSNHTQRLKACDLIRELTNKFNAVFIVNDDVDLALSSKADGVHLGQDDISLTEARHQLGENAIVGISCYNRFDLAEQATKNGADYIAFGRFFPSRTKPETKMANLSLIRKAKKELNIPVIAIGGISANNGKILIEAGADMLAAVEGVFGQPDIQAAAGSINQLFTNNHINKAS